MSHAFKLSDEEYARLAAYAAKRKQTPEKLFQAWVSEVTHKTKEPVPLNRKVGYEEEIQSHPLLNVAGIFSIGEPGWADKHDEYLAETYVDNHINDE